VYILMQPLNPQSQQKETWQTGQDRNRLDAVKEKLLHMGSSGSLQGVPTSWRM
jgi:hypothetical protein